MRNQDPKAFPDPEDKRAKVEGFGKLESKSGSTARRDPGAVSPVHHVPDTVTATPSCSERKGRKRFTQPLSEPDRALAKDAAAQARQLKRKHRALYTADARRFRKIVETRPVGGLPAETRTEARPASGPAHRSCGAEARPWHEMGRAIPTVHP
jgi:hypothetical protein